MGSVKQHRQVFVDQVSKTELHQRDSMLGQDSLFFISFN